MRALVYEALLNAFPGCLTELSLRHLQGGAAITTHFTDEETKAHREVRLARG